MVASAHDFEVNGVFYNIISLSDLTVEVTSGTEKYINTLDIPQFVQFSNKEFKVVRIGKDAFLNCVDLKKVNLPNTLVQIGDMTNTNGKREGVAFAGSGITEITIPSSVMEIDNCAFNNCTSLSKVIIEDGQTVLKLGCGGWLTTWKNELSGLFAHAKVREAYIGRNLDYNVHYDYYNYDYILPPFKQAGRTDCSPRSTITTVTFGDMVTEIPVQMFSETPSIKYVSLGRNIKIIKSRAFFKTAIEYFYFNNSLETIENEAFASCKNLTAININNKVNTIGDSAFENCTSLSDVTLGDGLKSLSNNLFAGCTTLKSISIPANIKTIGEKAFSGCTSLSNIVFNSEVLTIGDACFENCNFMALKLPEGLSVISKQCFKDNSSLTGIELPNSLVKISEESFAGCSKLEKISVPSTVNIIGENCFSGTNNLRIIKLYNQTPPSINENSFANLNYLTATLYVPDNSVEIYKNTEIWASFNFILPISKSDVKNKLIYIVDGEEYKIYEIETGVAITPEPAPVKEGHTFSGWSDIPATMPAHDVTVTGSFTVNKYKLTYKVDGEIYKTYDIEYGATITPEPAPTKEGYTFSGWSEIPETMPAHDVTVTSTFTASVVSEFKYNGIKYTVVSQSDQTVEVAASNQSAGSDGPASYSGDIVIPSTVSYGDKTYTVIGIGQSAFVNCVGITSVSLPNTLTYIRKEAFNLCLNLRSITIPESVTSYGYDVFSVTSISEITVLNPVPVEIPYNAFYYPQSINNCILYVPYGSSNAYKNATEWKKFKTIVEMGKKPDMLDGHEYVDLGLPSGKCWATMNYGATSPEGYGSYLEWSSNSIISSNWGSGWTTPSLQDIRELENNCTWTWGQKNGHSGYTVKGKNGNSIFLPASGYMMMGQSSAGKVDQWVYYWTSTKSGEMASIILSTATDVWYGEMNTVYTKLPIRPITKESHSTVVQKCETPIISYNNGKLTFACSTEDATCQYSITDSDIKVGSGNEVQLSVTYNISVYATKAGYENSETATATLCWIDQQPATEGITDGIANVPAKALLIKNNGGQLTIEGAADGEAISVYTVNGIQSGSAISQNGAAYIDTNLQAGSIAIVKIGNKSVKVVIK